MFEDYARRYDITFNATKNQIIIYKTYNERPPDTYVKIKGALITCFNNLIHLTHTFTVSKCIYDFNCQSNMFFNNILAVNPFTLY